MKEFKDATKTIQKELEGLITKAEALKATTNIPEICAFYRDVYELVDVLSAQIEVVKSVKTEFSKKVIPALFESSNVDNISTAGRQFILNPEFHASMPQDKQEKGLAWLKEKGYGMLVKEGVNAKTLSSAMKEYIEQKGELPPEDVMTIHVGHYISMRKK